jgi:hypothetical protein
VTGCHDGHLHYHLSATGYPRRIGVRWPALDVVAAHADRFATHGMCRVSAS